MVRVVVSVSVRVRVKCFGTVDEADENSLEDVAEAGRSGRKKVVVPATVTAIMPYTPPPM